MPMQRSQSGYNPAYVVASLVMVGVLGVQFLSGMALNLYVTISSNVGRMAQMMDSGPLLMFHMMLGGILVVGALFVVVMATPYGRWAIGCAAIALVGTLIAALAGLTFFTSGQGNDASYIMAVGFACAVSGYVAEVYKHN